jgi:hypothetical protein
MTWRLLTLALLQEIEAPRSLEVGVPITDVLPQTAPVFEIESRDGEALTSALDATYVVRVDASGPHYDVEEALAPVVPAEHTPMVPVRKNRRRHSGGRGDTTSPARSSSGRGCSASSGAPSWKRKTSTREAACPRPGARSFSTANGARGG